MGLAESLSPATGMFTGGLASIASYAWVLFFVVAVVVIVGIVIIIYLIKSKKSQWTHKLKIRRVEQNNFLSEPFYMNMRRFLLLKESDVFELEKPLLGGYLFPELDQYSNLNEFSIILDKNNRIYTNRGEKFDPDKSSVNVSAKHSEIDIQRARLRSDWQNMNKVSDKISWATIAKYAFLIILVMAVMVVAIVAIGKWGDAHQAKAAEAQAMESAMRSLSEAMTTIEATVNTQKLEISAMLKQLHGTDNLQAIINEPLV